MVDRSWEELQQLMAEEAALDTKWLENGGSYLCGCGRHQPCRRCVNGDTPETTKKENENGN